MTTVPAPSTEQDPIAGHEEDEQLRELCDRVFDLEVAKAHRLAQVANLEDRRIRLLRSLSQRHPTLALQMLRQHNALPKRS